MAQKRNFLFKACIRRTGMEVKIKRVRCQTLSPSLSPSLALSLSLSSRLSLSLSQLSLIFSFGWFSWGMSQLASPKSKFNQSPTFFSNS